MKSKKTGSGRKNGGKRAGGVSDKDRRKFMKVLGSAAVVGATGLDDVLLSHAFGATHAITAMSGAEATPQLRATMASAARVSEIEGALAKVGLTVRAEKFARVYQPISRNSGKAKPITIVPYHSEDKNSRFVGGLGISEGEPASAITVELDGTKVVSFTTHDVLLGKLVERTISTRDLLRKGTESFVETDLPREKLVPHISVETSADLAERTFRELLSEEQKAGVYTAEQVRGFLTNMPTVRLMAQLQHARYQGLIMSPGHSCCCCCSCCWGSCSSCSAVSSTYLSDKYKSRAGISHAGHAH